MSLFRAVRSFVGRGRDNSDENVARDSALSPKSPKVKVVIDAEFRGQADKLKSLWALYSNMRSDVERETQFQKVLPLFVSLYRDKDFRIATETFAASFIYVLLSVLVGLVKET